MKRPAFQHVGVVPNLEKEGTREILHSFIPELIRVGFSVFVEEATASAIPAVKGFEVGIPEDCDVLTSVGGDGTMLMAARRYLDWEVPILGVKSGRLGFLTEPPGADTARRLAEGRYVVQKRMRVFAEIKEGDKVVEEFNALNDVVVHVAGSSRIVQLRTGVNGTLIREYSADGVIVSTPTGSTAYSLSAGGPVLTPTMEAMVLTPLAPHTLSVRPLVLDPEGAVRIDVLSANTVMRVTVDGQKGIDLHEGQYVVVTRSEKVTHLLVPENYDFFELLREKL